MADHVRATTVGAYVQLAPGDALRVTTVGAYVQYTRLDKIRVTTAGAYVQLRTVLVAVAPVVYASAYGPHGIMVSLTYDAPAGANHTMFRWEYSDDDGDTWQLLTFTNADTAYYRHHPLTPASTYLYRAYAYRHSAGPVSNTASATTHSLADLASGAALWIDVRDSSNNKLGPGPLTEIVSFRITRRLSRAGEIAVDFPATYARLHQIQSDSNPLLHNDRYLYCYGILDGAVTLLGAGIVKEIALSRRGGAAPTIVASGPDLLGELRRVTVYNSGRPWQYSLEDNNAAPAAIINGFATTPELPDDWDISGNDPMDTAITAKFVHASVLGALIDVGAKVGEYFRLGSANNGREVVWIGPPSEFSDCGVRAELSVDPIAAETNDDICLITDIQEIRDSWDIYTKTFAFGAGQGHDRLDLSAVTIWPDGHRYRSTITSISGNGTVVTVDTSEDHDLTLGESVTITGTENFDGTWTVFTVADANTFSFEDTTVASESTGLVYGASTRTLSSESWTINRSETSFENGTARTAYGYHHTALQFKEISPISNTDADVATAANALWAAAYHWLRTHDAPAKFYRLAVAKLNSILYPGQTIRVVAKGYVEGSAYLNIDTTLTILETVTEVGAGGVRTTGLTVATTERWPASDGDQAAQEFHQAEVYQSLAQLGPAVDTISYRESIDDDTGATFYFWLGPEVALVNSVLLRFRTDKLRSTVKSVGGSSTTTSSGGGSTPTTTSGGGSTPTTSSGGGSTETSDPDNAFHGHDFELANGTTGNPVYYDSGTTALYTTGGGTVGVNATNATHSHDVDIPNHTHDVTVPAHTHDVTVPAHTHDVTATVDTEYGIYEDPGTAYAATDLEFSINGGAWRSDIDSLGSSWYALDLTAEVVATGLRPRQASNSVAVRVKSASEADNKVQITAQIERRCVIQSIAEF
ncbi:MAG TPA: fibronectin type III domain-containing protein [Candidatus Competibacter phosphatis]|nr:fibronectin type III domain-containing protein [Candidatus Competibacter phosphatis]